MKKIKIAYITSEDPNDINTWSGTSNNILKCLRKTNFEIITFGPLKSYLLKILKILEIFYKLIGIKYDPDRNLLLSKIYANKIKKIIKKKNVDYIFVHQCSLVSYLKTDIPIYIWTDLTFDLFCKTYFYKYKKFSSKSITNGNKLEKMALIKAKKILYSTEYVKINAVKKYKINPKKIKVLPFGCDMPSISKKKLDNKLKKRINTLKNKVKLLTIGTDWQRKNMDKAINVNNEINKLKIKSELTIVGVNPKSNRSLPKNTKIIGFLDKKDNKELEKLKKLYLNSHFLIHLSNAEAFGLVLNEASAYGLPIIANNIDGIKYVIRKNYSLFFNPSCKAKIIAKQISQLCKNKSKYKSFSLESHSSSKLNNWNSISGRLNKILSEKILEENCQ